MTTAQLINRIIEKLGGNRVEFRDVASARVDFVHSSNYYCAVFAENRIEVLRFIDHCPAPNDDLYSVWMRGVLNGHTRNDAGELVEVKS
jgi:hypothetical protein